MNYLGYDLTFRSLLRVFDEGKEEDVERGEQMSKESWRGSWVWQMVPKSESLCV